jgi:hypothetical protein
LHCSDSYLSWNDFFWGCKWAKIIFRDKHSDSYLHTMYVHLGRFHSLKLIDVLRRAGLSVQQEGYCNLDNHVGCDSFYSWSAICEWDGEADSSRDHFNSFINFDAFVFILGR